MPAGIRGFGAHRAGVRCQRAQLVDPDPHGMDKQFHAWTLDKVVLQHRPVSESFVALSLDPSQQHEPGGARHGRRARLEDSRSGAGENLCGEHCRWTAREVRARSMTLALLALSAPQKEKLLFTFLLKTALAVKAE